MEKKPGLERVIDWLLSRKKTTYMLFAVVILGFILRLIAAINLGVTADDMHFVTHAYNFLGAGWLVTYDQSSGLWFAFTDLMYTLFGGTQLTSRLAALLFGTATIPAMFLLARQFFSEKISLISAFLLSVAPFHIKNTLAEMDVTAMFFVISAMVFFISATKKNKPVLFVLAGIFMGLAVYTKVYPLLFIPSLLLIFGFMKKRAKRNIFSKTNTKNILIFLAVIFIFTLPALTHNFLLYQDKGFMDLHFTRTFGLGEDVAQQYYSWDPIWGRSNSWLGLILGDTDHVRSGTPLLLAAIGFIMRADPMNFFLGLLGLGIIVFNKKYPKDYLVFFILSIIFVLPFLASIILLAKHFMFLELFLIPTAALSILGISSLIQDKSGKNVLPIMLLLVGITALILLGSPRGITHFYGKNHVGQVIEFREERIDTNDLIIFDSRIYRGRVHWMGFGSNYLEGTEFLSFLQAQDELPGNTVPIDVYYVECVLDDCGWGTIKDQPEFNSSMESLTETFSSQGQVVERIIEPNKREYYLPFLLNDKTETINIHHANAQLKESILSIAQSPKTWFLYTIDFKPIEEQFDYYEASGFFQKGLDSLAHLIKFMALILAILSPLAVIYYYSNL